MQLYTAGFAVYITLGRPGAALPSRRSTPRCELDHFHDSRITINQMMKPINILSLLQARASLNEENFGSYTKHYGVDIRDAEIDDVENLANAIRSAGSKLRVFEDFYVGYKIPQIGKEFDLLRFGQHSIVNIEVKRDCTVEKVKAQLVRNKYYLSFIGRKIFAFTFVSNSGELFFFLDDGQLQIVNPAYLTEILAQQTLDKEAAPDSLFNPSDYLVSPFNSTDKFLAGKYFLTHQQEESKDKILQSFKLATGATFMSITGSAGTGKTLLTFDIARHLYAKGEKILVIHCGQLNDGHDALAKCGWIISSIKNYKSHGLTNFDLVVVDEAQRIYKPQLDDIVDRVNAAGCGCIFSYDKTQTLSSWEAKNDTAGKIDSIALITRFKLSEKIRTNKEIAGFIKLLFNNKKTVTPQSSENIKINYFSNNDDAKEYLNELTQAEWEVLRFTPSQYKNEHHEKYFDASSKTSHQVIGQEFDSVAIALDSFFAYDDDGDLTYRGGAYYAPTKMLFQNITRARRRLNLVVINNHAILSRCLEILK
jgi:Uncharacterized conserved protein (DUF2075)